MSRSKKRMSICLMILIFSTFFGSSFQIFSAGGTSIYLFRLVFILFAVIHIIYENRHKKETPHLKFMQKYKNILISFVLFDMITVIFTPDISMWVDGQITFVINIALIYFIYYYTDSRKDLDNYIKIYMLGIFMTMVVAIYEYLTGEHLISNNYIYSMPRSEWAITELSKYPTGFLFNPNNIGVAMLIGAGYGLVFLREGVKFSKIKYAIWCMVAIYVAFATGSRGAITFIVFSTILSPMFIASKLSKKMFGMILLAVLAICLYYVLYDFIWDQLESSGLLEGIVGDTEADEGRWELMRQGISVMPDSLFLGTGFRTAERVIENAYGASRTLAIHNFWIEMLVTNGIPGTIMFLRLYFLVIKSQFRLRKYYVESAAILVSLLIFAAAGIIPPTIVTLHFIWLIFGFALAAEKVYHIEYE